MKTEEKIPNHERKFKVPFKSGDKRVMSDGEEVNSECRVL